MIEIRVDDEIVIKDQYVKASDYVEMIDAICAHIIEKRPTLAKSFFWDAAVVWNKAIHEWERSAAADASHDLESAKK